MTLDERAQALAARHAVAPRHHRQIAKDALEVLRDAVDAEREACAQEIETMAKVLGDKTGPDGVVKDLAVLIRSRS